MLTLKNIVKNYYMGEEVVRALRGVSLNFRKSEFVSILGQSGCGKTTLLNIVGGLDKYTAGDLIINGVSTKKYSDRDWDNYRNLRVGFVFQSYNLIPHQTVLGNVELALTLSGVDAKTRKKKAIEALEKVGLHDQINKKPNQLSGGQMQRVAIARAIVNNPEIILADEPTGALDSETSLQIMDILKDLSKEKLVVMVTHNPELANTYSSRIIRLKDGQVIDDTNPYVEVNENQNAKAKKSKKAKKSHSMGIFTAIRLSFKNLLTKKARTLLTSFAGSIGIIGIALILSLSTGFNAYIDTVQRDTLSNYPITINKSGVDITGMLEEMSGEKANMKEYPSGDDITSNGALGNMFSSIFSSQFENDLVSFKKFLEEDENKKEYSSYISAVQYTYNLNVEWYTQDGVRVNDFDMMSLMGMNSNNPTASLTNTQSSTVFTEMIDNQELLKSQYDVLKGDWPKGENKANQVVLVVDNYNSLSDYNLYNIGYEADALEYQILKTYLMMAGLTEEVADSKLAQDGLTKDSKNKNYKFSDFIGQKYKIMLSPNYYVKGSDNLYEDVRQKGSLPTDSGLQSRLDLKTASYFTGVDENLLKDSRIKNVEEEFLPSATEVEIVGIVRKKDGVASGALTGTICYTKELTEKLIEETLKTQIYIDQLNSSNSVVKGENVELSTIEQRKEYAEKFGVVDINKPTQIAIYPTSFENKDKIIEIINDYNSDKEENSQIRYVDYLGIMMSSITVIINAISYVLIAFVSISLIVSSIMIGIITYISVLERTKEIGVLRSLGASKKDISRVFNAETLIIGFVSGSMGILATILLNIPITLVVQSLADITAVSTLPIVGAVVLVIISMALTLISGLIPSKLAAKKDPVIALRTE